MNSYSQTDLLKENFETDITTGWQTFTSWSNGLLWGKNVSARYPFSIDKNNVYSAVCPWQREKRSSYIVSPRVIGTNYKSLYLSFYAGFNGKMLRSDSLELWIKKDSLLPWTSSNIELLWSAKAMNVDTLKSAWAWHRVEVDLYDYRQTNFNLAWVSHGTLGDMVALDSVHLTGGDLSKRAEIISMSFPNQTTTPTLNKSKDTISVVLANQIGIKSITPTIVISKGATINPENGAVLRYNQPDTQTVARYYPFTVTAADNSVKKTYILKVNVDSFGKEANITSFSIPGIIGTATMSNDSNTVSLNVAGGTNLTKIKASIGLSFGAKSSPSIDSLFTFTADKNFEIVVTPQDPQFKAKTWKIKIHVIYDNKITSFSLPGSTDDAIIDSDKHTILLEVDNTVNLVQVTPTITVSPGCNPYPSQDTKLTFIPNLPYTYRVSGDNVNFVNWTITISRKIQATYEEGFDQTILPEGWTSSVSKKGTEGWVFKDQPRAPFNLVYRKSTYSALHNWTYNTINDSLISKIYNADQKYNNISVIFYAGFNKVWLDSADLKFYIIKTADNQPILKWDAKQDTISSKKWQWRSVQLSLPELNKTSFRLAWQYTGTAGDLVGIDRLMILCDNSKSTTIDNTPKDEFNPRIYPNPAKDHIWIEESNLSIIKIYSLSGTLLKEKTITSDREKIDLDEIPAGIYLIEINQNLIRKNFKLIISK